MATFEIFREKKKSNTEENISDRYSKLALRCSILKWISLITLVAFVLVSVWLHGDDLSFESIRYIVRYVKDDPITLIGDGDSFCFDYDSSNKVYLLGNDFAIVGKNNISIYDFSGKQLFSENISMSSPVAQTYGNELIVYEIGGKEVRIYGSYSLQERITFETPVYGVSVADNGYFLVLTSSNGYKSGYRVYKDKKNLYVIKNLADITLQSAEISKDGNNIVTASVKTVDNYIFSVLQLYDNVNKSALFTDEIQGEYPLSVHCLGNYYVLFTDKAYRTYDSSFNLVATHLYGNKKPLKYDISEKNIIVTYEVSSFSQDTIVEVAAPESEKTMTFIVKDTVSDFEMDENRIYCLCNNTIETYSITDGIRMETYNFKNSYQSILKMDNSKFLLLRPDELRIFIKPEN